jgi:hypothetical protein
MATLKISDLSVGDWVGVRCGTKINTFKVEEIRFNNIIHKYVAILNNKSYGLSTTELHPIPITAEMLEMNGFERLLERDLFYHSESGLEVAFEDGEWMHTINLHEYTIHTISGVHHIQHLLRLYGCEKEINL